ncbi:Galectin-4, partial [Stegodyphus mimosarum]
MVLKFRKMFGDCETKYPDPEAVVYPTQVPYRGPIPGGLHDGKLVEIKGTVPYGADVFEINFLTGLDPRSDRPLHISVRMHGRIVVRNSYEMNTWGNEERHGIFPFVSGREFTVMIMVDPVCYRIAVNGQHCWEFHHRISYTRVSSIYIDGSVRIERIEFVNKISPYQPGVPASVTVCPPAGRMTPGVPATPCMPSGVTIPAVNPIPYHPSGGRIVPPPEQIGVCPGGYISGGVQPSSNLTPVYNPPIPYDYPIYGGLKPGMMIYISGRPSASPYRFSVNLQSGTSPYPPPDIAFHFDVRFYNHTIVRNSRTNNVWAAEEASIPFFPFQPAVNFDMIIRVETDTFMVALNGQHFIEFRQR